MAFLTRTLTSDDSLSAGILESIRSALLAGKSPSPQECVALYSIGDVGIGGRFVPWDHSLAIRSDNRTMDAGARELRSAVDSYAADLDLFLAGYGTLPNAWMCEALKNLVLDRQFLGRALTGFGITSADASGKPLLGRWEGLDAAVQMIDQRAYEKSTDLMRAAKRALAHGQNDAGKGGTRPDWMAADVTWWSDVVNWAKNGISDADHAEAWLIPALNRAADRMAAESDDAPE